jgi:uncharacterized protein
MSYTVTKYPQGTFSWADVMSTDTEATKKFMTTLMGWDSKDFPTDQGPVYTMFSIEGKSVAGLSQMPPNMKGVPSHWNSYISVDDIEEVVGKVEELGGKVTMPTMKVMTAGKMAAISDPTGAAVMLWEAGDLIGAGLVNTIGAMGWNELRTKDMSKAEEFYGKLLGWTFEPMGDDNYHVIKNNGRMNGGVMLIDKNWGDVTPHWATYFTVADIDKTEAKAKENGGSVMGDITDAKGVGRFAMITDPAGATFTTIQLSTDPDPWVE